MKLRFPTALKLVTRTRMEEDQRRLLIRLTPRAEQLVAEMVPLIVEQYRIIEVAYGPELIQELYEIMDRVIAAALYKSSVELK